MVSKTRNNEIWDKFPFFIGSRKKRSGIELSWFAFVGPNNREIVYLSLEHILLLWVTCQFTIMINVNFLFRITLSSFQSCNIAYINFLCFKNAKTIDFFIHDSLHYILVISIWSLDLFGGKLSQLGGSWWVTLPHSHQLFWTKRTDLESVHPLFSEHNDGHSPSTGFCNNFVNSPQFLSNNEK